MLAHRALVVCGWIVGAATVACSSASPGHAGAGDSGSTAAGGDADVNGDALATASDGGDHDAAAESGSGSGGTTDSGGDGPTEAGATFPVVGPGNASCANATVVPLDGAQYMVDLQTDTSQGTHSVGAPCATDGGEMFFSLTFSKPVFVYADTFGATYPTVLYWLDDACAPLTTSITPGEVLCNAAACGTQQSQVVALLAAGSYALGVSGAGASGPVTAHLQWALAPSGAFMQLPKGNSMQSGTTMAGTGNIQGLGSCAAVGPEDGFWWTSCPADPGGALQASTCGGASWETVLDVQFPGSIPYACNADSCGLQTTLDAIVPAGAGLRVLDVEGQSGSDYGPYTLTVSRP